MAIQQPFDEAVVDFSDDVASFPQDNLHETLIQSHAKPRPNVSSSSIPVDAPARSAVERFVDSFFQPANIKWMLIIGAAIVLGSSLMLVTQRWSYWPAAIKFATIISYTAAIYLFAEQGDRRLGLKSTGNVLRGLTILLMPVMMLGLSWVATQNSWTGLPSVFEAGVLLLPATLLLVTAGRNIFHHFLRGHQTTFLGCYVALAMAGCLPRVNSPAMGLALVFVAWAVMTIGAAKVNRHVFWLTEEHRLPRVFGFFPILLLGLQFLLISGTKALLACPPEWIGSCLVMFAGTVLLTARTVANVYRARTGDLVRPLPWSIVLPLVVGILLTFSGVIVSCSGFSFVGATTTYAVVPTALLASVLLLLVSIDTRHQMFTWLSLILVVVAYQASPVLIKDLIATIKSNAASAVHEDKLPIAFYGITYLPLLGLLTLASVWTRKLKRPEIALPLQQFVGVASALLWATSAFHFKAFFLVTSINIVAFVAYAIAFGDRRYGYVAVLATGIATLAYFPFAHLMFGSEISIVSVFLSMSVFGMVLYSTKNVDRILGYLPLPMGSSTRWMFDKELNPIPLAHIAGLGLLIGLAANWTLLATLTLGRTAESGGAAVSLLLLGALSLLAYRTRNYFAGLMFALLVLVCATSMALEYQFLESLAIEKATVVCTIVSFAGLSIIRFSRRAGESWETARTGFGYVLPFCKEIDQSLLPKNSTEQAVQWLRCHIISLSDVGTVFVAILGTFVYAPTTFVAAMDCSGNHWFSWYSLYVFAWLLACATLLTSRIASTVLAVVAPLYLLAAVNTLWPSVLVSEMIPLVLGGCSAAICLATHLSGKSHLLPACVASRLWLVGICVFGLTFLSMPLRIASLIALATLYLTKGRGRFVGDKETMAVLLNVQAIFGVAGLSGSYGWIFDLRGLDAMSIASYLFPTLVVNVIYADLGIAKINKLLGEVWGMLTTCLAVLAFVVVVLGPVAHVEGQWLVAIGLSVAFGYSIYKALASHSRLFAWLTFVAFGLGIVWSIDQRLLYLGTGVSQVVLVVAGATSLWLSRRTLNHNKYGVYSQPMMWIGLVAPAVVACLGLVHEAFGTINPWLLSSSTRSAQYNYAAMLAAAGIYFVHGLKTRQRRYTVLAAVILNAALLLCCRTFHLSDPQFYCVPIGLSILGLVELLKREIQVGFHDPMRYIGALIILVSPVFGMRDSSWLHLFSLMVLCVVVILIAMGLRIRALIYTGSAFLFADLAGMVIRSTINNPTLLWVGGIGLGISVIALAAVCENHRENLLSKIRLLSAELATWN